jgi:dihydrofolate reductase
MSKNFVVGKTGEVPWYISDDLKRTKKLTVGHPLIMGRKTHESIGGFYKSKNPGLTENEIVEKRVLPKRTNIVITRDENYKTSDKVKVVRNIKDAINIAQTSKGGEEIFIFGGAEIYKQTIDLADRIYLTYIDKEIDGDAFFPKDFEDKFTLVSTEKHIQESDGLRYEFRIYERL